MKYLFSLFAIVLTLSVNSQVEFYIENQLVDQTVVQQVELISQSPSAEHVLLGVKNISGATVDWTVDYCMLSDHQNISGVDYQWMHEADDPMGIHTLFDPTMSDPCYVMPAAGGIDLLNNEKMHVKPGFSVLGGGCESYRFYARENGVILDSIDITFCSYLNVEEKELEAVQVYPNPASKEISIEANGVQVVEITMLDLNGRVVWTKDQVWMSQLKIDLNDVSNGTYVLRATLADGSALQRKVVVVH